MEEIIINPEFKKLIPPMLEEEYKNLERQIINEGCRDAIILWNSTIIDGHNRYEICTKNGIEFNTVEKEFDDEEHAKKWIITNQLSRRNLSDYQRVRLNLELTSILEEIAKENQRKSKGRGQKGPSILTDLNEDDEPTSDNEVEKDVEPKPTGSVRKQIAEISNVSEGTVHKVKKIHEHEDKISEDTKKQLEAGKLSINEVYNELKEQLKGTEPAHVSLNSGVNEWYTPSNIIEAARDTMGSIDTDPASSEIANETVKASVYFTEQTNGLDKEWIGNVWMNPPYAQPLIEHFCDKFVNELANKNMSQGCIIVNNATETKWFQTILEDSNAMCFIKSRVKFVDANSKKGAPLQGQLILYFGSNVDKFMENFENIGKCRILLKS